MRSVHLALALLLSAGIADAQGPSSQSAHEPDDTAQAAFRSSIDLVGLSVVVTDGAQKFLTGLSASDFAVYEDGVQQDVSFFAAGQTPLDLAILLDTSISMAGKLDTAQAAAIGFIGSLRPGDRVSIVDIKDATRVAFPLSRDFVAAAEAINATTARGGTALYNGIYVTLKDCVKQRRTNGEVRRQALVVLSDGDDTASLVTFDDVMETAKQSGVAIYTITLKGEAAASLTRSRYFSQSEYSMRALASETGARAFFPTAITDLADVYKSIADELASQYALGYTSKNPKHDGAYRRVIVRLSDRPGAKVRTRSGYLSVGQQRASATR